MDNLEKSIIQTLAYFDYFSHPLTNEELFRYLWKPPLDIKYDVFLARLNEFSIIGDKIQKKYCYYFLSGRESIVEDRRLKTYINDRKHKLARKAVKKIRYIPFVRAVMLCNNSSFEMAKEESDIDIAIIVKSKRMWIARLFTTIILSVFGMRRHRKKITNRICLSFYACDENLDFSSLIITEPDIGLVYWIAQFVAIYDPKGIRALLTRENSWLKKYVPNALECDTLSDRFFVNGCLFSKAIKFFFEKMWEGWYGNIIDSQAKNFQLAKMKMNSHSVQNEPDTRVIISDQVLKFHEKDRRIEYKEEWVRKVDALI
ncbi:MAG: hypothetical protein ABH832_01785 [bacterium]